MMKTVFRGVEVEVYKDGESISYNYKNLMYKLEKTPDGDYKLEICNFTGLIIPSSIFNRIEAILLVRDKDYDIPRDDELDGFSLDTFITRVSKKITFEEANFLLNEIWEGN